MRTKCILTFILPLLISGVLKAQDLPQQKLVPKKWIDSWLLCGPFPFQTSRNPDHAESQNFLNFETDFLKRLGGELNPKLKAGKDIKFADGIAKCVLYTSPDSVIDFSDTIEIKNRMNGYAYTEIEANESKIWFFAFSPRDGGRLWVNGEKVWQFSEPARAFEVDTYIIPVHIKKGKNTILFKMKTIRSLLQLYARFLPLSTGEITKRGEEFRITTDEKGEVSLTSKYALPVLQQLIQEIDIEVVNYEKKTIYVASDRNYFFRKLNLDANTYQPYTAIINTRLKDGETIKQEIPFFAGAKKEYTLFSDRRTNYRIALDSEASESERWAANELQHWLNKISGAYFPIQDISQPFKGPQIILGFNEVVQKIIKTKQEQLE